MRDLRSATQLANSVEYSGEIWELGSNLSRLGLMSVTIERGTNPQQIGVTITAQLGLQGSEMEQLIHPSQSELITISIKSKTIEHRLLNS